MNWERIFIRVQAAALVVCCLTAVAWGPRQLVAMVLGASAPLPGEVVPRQVPYRGYLEQTGVPVDVPTPMTFTLTLADGGAPWAYSGMVPVVRGNFSVELGEDGGIPSNLLDDPGVTLTVLAGGQSLGNQRLLTVPFSQRSARAYAAAPGSELDARLTETQSMVVPVGTISAFAGATSPAGWLRCDGRALRTVDYPRLAAVIQTTWGNGSTGSNGGPPEIAGADFNLPDLRGRFLRGTDQGTGRDPDSSLRTSSSAGGNSGPLLGSTQDDAFQGHAHNFSRTNYIPSSPGGGPNWVVQNPPYSSVASGDPIASSFGSPRNSYETRPKNASVEFIIRY
jgi:microcystin-dependent protein